MITKSQKVLLMAIKAALFGTKPSYPADTDWDEVVKEAKAQTVLGIISPVIPVHDESVEQCKAAYMRILYEQDQLIKLFDEHNIPCVILKGTAAAIYYPKPYLRAMGDVDILVPRNRFYEAVELMEENGFIYKYGKGDDGKLGIHSVHIGYEKNGIVFELHHHFSSSGFDIDLILEKAINKRVYYKLNGYNFPMLPDIENGLVLLGHMDHHLKDNSLGLRQIIDWELYFYSVMNKDTWYIFAPVARKAGLLKLAATITKLCERQLGLTKTITLKNKTDDEYIYDQLIENILTYGNFGRKQPRLTTINSGERISTVTDMIKSKGLFKYFQDNGLATWKLCKKYPALKPFAFIYGFFRFIIRGIKGIIKTGKIKEQIKYVRDKKSFDQKIGI